MLKKIANWLKLNIEYYWSQLIGIPHHNSFPSFLSVEPVNFCNLQCPECPAGNNQLQRAKGIMDFNLYRKIIDQLSPYLLHLFLYFQGEPFLHPQLSDMIAYANKHNIYTAISTNGHYFTDDNVKKIISSGLKKIIISIDGSTQSTYCQYRKGGNLSKVISGIERLVSYKNKTNSQYPIIIIQFLVFQHNEHQINEIKQMGLKIGVDRVELKSAQFYDFKHGNKMIPSIKKYSRYKQNDDGTYSIKNKFPNRCWRLWSSAVITWDGNVLPCCYDKDAKFVMGNMNKQLFSEIWENDKYNKFRAKILSSRKEIEMCQNCTEGLYQ